MQEIDEALVAGGEETKLLGGGIVAAIIQRKRRGGAAAARYGTVVAIDVLGFRGWIHDFTAVYHIYAVQVAGSQCRARVVHLAETYFPVNLRPVSNFCPTRPNLETSSNQINGIKRVKRWENTVPFHSFDVSGGIF